MPRGSRSLFASLFDDDQINSVTTAPERKGRSEILIKQRNELLICRYYYLVKIQGKNYMSALEILQSELFISTTTITDILSDNNKLLREINSQKPTIKDLKEKFPMMVWIEPKATLQH